MQSMSTNNYYSTNNEYDYIMNKYPFHDSGIVDENLSDETGSVEEENPQAENQTEEKTGTPKKPSQSYLEIIAEAILKAPNRMMQLYEIYNYFQRKYRYFAEDVNKSWKNSVRHNLSLNDCFVKAGRGTNGKGHYWRIHDLAEREFEQGRFRRRRYRQQMREYHLQNTSATHHPSYPMQSVPQFYPPTSTSTPPYYMCSPPPPPAYNNYYSSPNTSTENHPMSPPTMANMCPTASTPSSSYAHYDPYAASYYHLGYQSMASSYASPNISGSFEN